MQYTIVVNPRSDCVVAVFELILTGFRKARKILLSGFAPFAPGPSKRSTLEAQAGLLIVRVLLTKLS